MDLIKKIRQAERQAREVVEKASTEAAEMDAEFQRRRTQLREDASRQRQQAIESAVAEGEKEAGEKIKHLEAAAEKDRRKLRQKTGERRSAAVSKITDYIKG